MTKNKDADSERMDICRGCGCYTAPFCLDCGRFAIARSGATTTCMHMDCQFTSVCPCGILYDEDHVLTRPYYEIAWYIEGIPRPAEEPRAFTEEEGAEYIAAVRKAREAGMEIEEEEEEPTISDGDDDMAA